MLVALQSDVLVHLFDHADILDMHRAYIIAMLKQNQLALL